MKEDDRFVGLSKDVKRLMKYRTKTVANLRAVWTRRCEKCDEIKPARTHHCSACGQCVFHMDHHCRKCMNTFKLIDSFSLAWINNCVGMENLRFFVLFLFYLWIGMIFMFISIATIWHHPLYVSTNGVTIC